MKKLTVVLGTVALIFAIADLIHGQHNGDAHRFYIHVAEFIFFSGFLILLEIHALKSMAKEMGFDHWLAALSVSIMSAIAGFCIFGLAGGGVHGDNGPLSLSFGLIGVIGILGVPICSVGAIVAKLTRRIPHS